MCLRVFSRHLVFEAMGSCMGLHRLSTERENKGFCDSVKSLANFPGLEDKEVLVKNSSP